MFQTNREVHTCKTEHPVCFVTYTPVNRKHAVALFLCMQEGSSTEHRIRSLVSSLQYLVYEYVCRSLFKADRLMFALHMVHGMFPDMFKENVSPAQCSELVEPERTCS